MNATDGKNPSCDTSAWDGPALAKLREWDPAWAEACLKMTTNPWNTGILPKKTVELVCVAIHSASANLNPDGMRRHILAAIGAGATRDEVLLVLKMASVLSIHSCSFALTILMEEVYGDEWDRAQLRTSTTPTCDRVRAAGKWNPAWDHLYTIDPDWAEELMVTGIGFLMADAANAKLIELLSIAFDATYTNMYAPGTRRHIKAALKMGISVREIMAVLKLCVIQGVQACNLGVPILAEALAK